MHRLKSTSEAISKLTTTLLRTVFSVAFCGLAAQAGTLFEDEGFNYTAGSSLNGQNGGSGWAGAWFTPGGLDATVNTPTLTFGSLSVSGGAASTAGFQPLNQGSSVATWIRTLGTPLGADNTTAYLSFLLRPDAGFGFYGGINFGNVFIGRSGNQAFYGLEGPVNSINLSSVSVVANQTAFLVLQVDFLPGNDRLSLYLNPTPGQPQPGTADVVKTDLDVGTVNAVVINNYGGFTTDEIRIGSTFASVTPVPEPGFRYGLGCSLLLLLGLRRVLSAPSA